jgi:predicted Zn-dependent protease
MAVRTVIPVLVAAAMLTACATTTGRDFNIVSTEQEVDLGTRFAAEVEDQETVLDDPAVQRRVRAMGDRLATHSPRQDVDYTFSVIDAPDTVNAFALPGGYMYVYTGLMDFCDNDAQLAAVMAHEIAHVAAYHHGEMLTRMYGYQLLASMALGEAPSQTAQTVASLFAAGIQSRYSQRQEYEADRLGMEILYRAGYPVEAMVAFMRKLVAYERERGGGGHMPLFASHPPTTDRLRTLQALAAQYPGQPGVERTPFEAGAWRVIRRGETRKPPPR